MTGASLCAPACFVSAVNQPRDGKERPTPGDYNPGPELIHEALRRPSDKEHGSDVGKPDNASKDPRMVRKKIAHSRTLSAATLDATNNNNTAVVKPEAPHFNPRKSLNV